MQKVLITGITGMAGSHLADFLLEHRPGVQIDGLLRWRSPRDNIRHLHGKVGLKFGDLTDFPSLVDVLGRGYGSGNLYDTIFHLAAQSYVPFSYQAPLMTYQTNVIGTVNLLEAVRRFASKATVHVCSSSEVYGQPDKVPITTDEPMKPMSPYGASKASADLTAEMYYRLHDIKTIRTRAFTHTGPRRGGVFVASYFAKQLAQVESGKSDTIFVGNLESVRTWCDVRDMVRAYVLAVEKCEPGTVWNIGGDTTTTVGDMLKIMLSLSSNPDAEIVQDPDLLRPADVTLQIPDTKPFREATGWKPTYMLKETLGDLLDWWRCSVGP